MSVATVSDLTYVQKAAAILVAMGRERAGRLLKYFKGGELKRLVDAAHSLGAIPQSCLEMLVEEFENEFAQGGGLLDSAETIDSIISEAFSPEEFKQMLEPSDDDGDTADLPPIWTVMDEVEATEITEFVQTEHPLICALVLSKLSPRKAADIVATFERDRRKQVLKHMLTLGVPSHETMRFVEQSLRERFGGQADDSSAKEGRVRVANVLNELDKPNMEEIFDDLANDADPDNIAAVKSLLFRFEDVVQLNQSSRSIIFDGIEADSITIALRGAESELKEAVLSSLGQRTRRMIESELSAEAPTPADKIAQARRQIAAAAIRLGSEGRIVLPSAQEQAA